MRIKAIRIYPIKSMGPVALGTARFDARGFEHDRRWMLIDSRGGFLSQRQIPSMAAFRVRVGSKGLSVTSPEGRRLTVPFAPDGEGSVPVSVWGSRCKGDLYSDRINSFFTAELSIECRLVKISDKVKRRVSWQYAVHKTDEVGFADGYPFLIAGEGSLKDLNSRLTEPLPMERFRPNLIVGGSEAFAEDGWRRIKIGKLEFHVVKPCARCVMTTIDQTAGEPDGPEPLATLSKFRLYERGGKKRILFGQNVIPESAKGSLSVGDEIKVLASKRPPRFKT